MGWAWSMCSVTSRRGSPPFMKEIYRSPSSREQLSGPVRLPAAYLRSQNLAPDTVREQGWHLPDAP